MQRKGQRNHCAIGMSDHIDGAGPGAIDYRVHPLDQIADGLHRITIRNAPPGIAHGVDSKDTPGFRQRRNIVEPHRRSGTSPGQKDQRPRVCMPTDVHMRVTEPPREIHTQRFLPAIWSSTASYARLKSIPHPPISLDYRDSRQSRDNTPGLETSMSVGDAEDESMAIVHSLRALAVDLKRGGFRLCEQVQNALHRRPRVDLPSRCRALEHIGDGQVGWAHSSGSTRRR